MSTLEPPTKKLKTEDDHNETIQWIDEYISQIKHSDKNLEPVLSDEFEKPLQLIKVYAGNVNKPQDLSRCVSVLNEKVPLKELQHLKRVRKHIVVLCPTHFLNGMSSIQEFIECNVNELKNVFDYFKEIEVPYFAPKTKQQFKEAIKYWSCNFHPNPYTEKLVSGSFFALHELKMHRTFMEMAFEVAKFYIKHSESYIKQENFFESFNAAVVVDPAMQAVVAVSFDNKQNHPLKHAAMVAIDNVAKTQDGGAWFDEEKNKDIVIEQRGIDPELLSYLKKNYNVCTFAANKFRSYKDISSEDMKSTNACLAYLCTDYYVYLLREPCLMCSMALVHARAKRIFFCFDNNAQGALKTRVKLQDTSSLNHHFEVFTGFL